MQSRHLRSRRSYCGGSRQRPVLLEARDRPTRRATSGESDSSGRVEPALTRKGTLLRGARRVTSFFMSNESMPDDDARLDMTPEPSPVGTTDQDVVEVVAEAEPVLDTLTQVLERQRENLSAAERLLAELDAARAEREEAPAQAQATVHCRRGTIGMAFNGQPTTAPPAATPGAPSPPAR